MPYAGIADLGYSSAPMHQDSTGRWWILGEVDGAPGWVPSGWSIEPAKDPAEALECPKSGCQRPKPAENATGGLTCWWCGHTGSWHEFPKRRVYEDGGK